MIILCWLILLNSCSFRISNSEILFYETETTIHSGNIIETNKSTITFYIDSKVKYEFQDSSFSYKNHKIPLIFLTQSQNGDKIELVDNFYYRTFEDLLHKTYPNKQIELIVGIYGEKSELKQGKFIEYKFSNVIVSANGLLYACRKIDGCHINMSYLINQKNKIPIAIKLDCYDENLKKTNSVNVLLVKRKKEYCKGG